MNLIIKSRAQEIQGIAIQAETFKEAAEFVLNHSAFAADDEDCYEDLEKLAAKLKRIAGRIEERTNKYWQNLDDQFIRAKEQPEFPAYVGSDGREHGEY